MGFYWRVKRLDLKKSQVRDLGSFCESFKEIYEVSMKRILPLVKGENVRYKALARKVRKAQKAKYSWKKLPKSMKDEASFQAFKDALAYRRGVKKNVEKFKAKGFRLKGFDYRISGKWLEISSLNLRLKVGSWMDKGSHKAWIYSKDGKWYLSLAYPKKLMKLSAQNPSVGIDLGLKSLMTLSTGLSVNNPRYGLKIKDKKDKLYAILKTKKLGSKSYLKLKEKIAKLDKSVENKRQDAYRKLSSYLVKNFEVICMEDIDLKALVKQNEKIKASLKDAAWWRLRQLIVYKALSYTYRKVVFVDPYYPSSHLCYDTGQLLDRKLNLAERSWQCPYCGAEHDRDLNAARNIEKEGLRILSVCSSDSFKPMVVYGKNEGLKALLELGEMDE